MLHLGILTQMVNTQSKCKVTALNKSHSDAHADQKYLLDLDLSKNHTDLKREAGLFT